jgi:hypothetical protein
MYVCTEACPDESNPVMVTVDTCENLPQ